MGFEPVELGDVGYAFKYESLNFIYMPDEDDEQFLRIAVPYMFDVTDENQVIEAVKTVLTSPLDFVREIFSFAKKILSHRYKTIE